MARYNVALLWLLASTAAAVPHYGQYGHRHPVPHKSGSHSSGIFPPGPYPTGGPTAPYGQGNTTAVGPTGSAPVSSAPVSSNPALTSVVTVVPQPASSGSGNSPVGGSSAAGECGPATVTVTSANTVTVTVPASSVPVGSAPVESPIPTTSAPYSNGTTTAPVGTGSAGTESALPSFTASSPIIPVPGPSSNGVQLPSVAHPVPLASSTNEDSPLASSTNENSPETAAATSPSAGGQFYQSETTPAVVPSSTVANSPEQASSPLSTPTSSSAPSSTVANSPEQASSSSSTPKPSTAPSTDNVIPRGLVYNEASLTSHFDNAPVGWLYNWDSSPGGAIDTSKEFIPMLWNTSEVYHTPHWAANADAAIAAGSKHLLAFNEPDLAAQANMDVGQSVQGWMTYMEPFHTKHNGDVKLGSPSVCNGPDQNQGLAYLTSFLSQCAGCHVDFLAIHWYGLATDDGVQDLKDHVGKAVAMAEGRPVWLTEFQPQGSDEQQAGFLGKILPWLDDGSNGVERYAYYRVDTMVSGASLTQAGAAYAA